MVTALAICHWLYVLIINLLCSPGIARYSDYTGKMITKSNGLESLNANIELKNVSFGRYYLSLHFGRYDFEKHMLEKKEPINLVVLVCLTLI